jgi:hypothetical protein
LEPSGESQQQQQTGLGLHRGFQILLALLAWITQNKQSPPSPTALSEAPIHRQPPLLMGRPATPYPAGPSKAGCTRWLGWQLPAPPSPPNHCCQQAGCNLQPRSAALQATLGTQGTWQERLRKVERMTLPNKTNC